MLADLGEGLRLVTEQAMVEDVAFLLVELLTQLIDSPVERSWVQAASLLLPEVNLLAKVPKLRLP